MDGTYLYVNPESEYASAVFLLEETKHKDDLNENIFWNIKGI